MPILVIDNDDCIRDALTLFFEAEGYIVLTLDNAEEGLEAVKEHSFDIIIADHRLPRMTGVEFFERTQNTTSSALRILTTAYRTDDLVSRANAAGVHRIVDKPLTAPQLRQALANRLLIKRNKEPRSKATEPSRARRDPETDARARKAQGDPDE